MTVECNWTLPTEITQRVTTFLPLDDLVRFSKCCKFFFQAACEPNAEYWKAMVQRRGIELLPSETDKGAVKRFFGETVSLLNGINDYSSDIKDNPNFKRILETCLKIDRLWPRLRAVFDFLKTQKAELILDTVVVKATKRGNTAAARFFLEEIGGIEACKGCPPRVIESGNLSLIQLFHSYNLLKLDASLFIAAREGHLEVVDFLMEHSSFTPETLRMARKWAAVGGNLEIYELLSKNDKTPEAAQGLELLRAVENGDFERVREIFEKQLPDIYYRGLVLIWAAGEGDYRFIQYLFTMGLELDVYDMALWASSLRGRAKTFMTMRLLHSNDDVLKEAVLCAIKNKCLSVVVKATLGFFNLKIFQSWVIAACERGYLPIVEELVGDENIDRQTHLKALLVAAREGHLPVIQFLLRLPSANEYFFYQPILAAAANGHLECIKALVQTGRWDSLLKRFAIEVAQVSHFGDVVKWIEEQPI